MGGVIHWWFWFGPAIAYQLLPHRTCIGLGAFGMVTGQFTNTYHPLNLGAHPPCCTFTNLYHRGLGLHIDRSVVASRRHQATGWCRLCRVIRVDNVAHGVEPRRTIRSGGTVVRVAHRHREEKSFLNQAGRLVFLYPWW
jgi:hypothetical protein